MQGGEEGSMDPNVVYGGQEEYNGPRPVLGYVCLASNIPLRTTNTQLAEKFMTCGQLINIERRNFDAYIFYASPEFADRAVGELNGIVIHDSLISVSRGGTMWTWALPAVPQPTAPGAGEGEQQQGEPQQQQE
eukprot:PhF_6_TR15483/c0_g1_i1/m.24083